MPSEVSHNQLDIKFLGKRIVKNLRAVTKKNPKLKLASSVGFVLVIA